jgi:hypothetical protein
MKPGGLIMTLIYSLVRGIRIAKEENERALEAATIAERAPQNRDELRGLYESIQVEPESARLARERAHYAQKMRARRREARRDVGFGVEEPLTGGGA